MKITHRPGRLIGLLAIGLMVMVLSDVKGPQRALAGPINALVQSGATAQSAIEECLVRPDVMVLSGTYTERIRVASPPDGLAVDARDGVSLTTGVRALELGSSAVFDGGCVVGWSVFGQQSRTLTWRQMHDDIEGSALRVNGSNYVVDGLRAENVEDAFDPRGGEGFEVRNMWTEYIRDDCIENDERRAGIVIDSLFDGCYTFFSEQDAGTVVGESLIFDRVLVRLQPMPGPYGIDDSSILGHGSFFKKFQLGGRHEPVIRDSVFFLEGDCNRGCKDWPAGTTASNVTIVWVGEGEFPMSVLPGMTLTTDRSVWDEAAADWKQRHGCTTIDQPCTRLHDPGPGDPSQVPEVVVVASDAEAGESGDGGAFTVSLSEPAADPLSVLFTVSGSAANGTDYAVLSSPVVIPAGDVSAVIGVVPVDDDDVEGSETVTVALVAGAGYTVGVAASDTVTIIDNEDVGAGTFEKRVVAGSDDAEERASGSVGLTSSDLELVRDKNRIQTVGMRWTEVAVPQGATITNAWVQFTVDETGSGDTNLVIAGHDIDNSPTFVTSSFNISGRPLTASVPWAVDAWNTKGEAGPAQQTPNLAAVVQEIVSRPDWASGNALSLIFTGTGTRTAESFNGESSAAPLLHIEWGGNPSQVPEVVVVASDAEAGESGDGGAFTVSLSEPAADPLSVLFTVSGSATNGTDYAVLSSPVVIPAGDVSAVIGVVPVDDDDVEGSETVTVALVAGAGYTVGVAASDTVTIIDNEDVGAGTFEKRVVAGSDDAEERASGSVGLTSSDLELVRDKNRIQTVGMRWTEVAVPQGATITNAWVQFTVDETGSGDTNLVIAGHDIDNSPTFVTSSFNISGRPLTASVPWAVDAWNTKGEAGPAQQTPNLAAVVQEIVSRPDWASGNALSLIFTGTGTRTAESFNGESSAAPLLHIEYAIG